MRKFIIVTSLIILAAPIVSFAQINPTAACAIPANPTAAADWITTITCLQNRIGALENRVSALESKISSGSTLPGIPAVPAIPTTNKCDAATNICTVQQGVSNDGVKAVQTFLQSVGTFSVTPTGYFGPITKSAVQQFQAVQGLTQTGVVDQATLNKIQTMAPQIAPSVAPTLQQVKAAQ